MKLQLKKDFLLGVASAATQIEGGECDHCWNDWYKSGHIKDGTNPARANDHYNRWREDADIMTDMGIQVYRLGIEWARICPTENSVDENVIQHYKEELTYLREKGIKVLLTIHHFTNPMWFEKKGAFAKVENEKYFIDFVKLVVRSFGDLVSEYITINEPNVYATNSYFYGMWPPGEKSLKNTITVLSNMAVFHIHSYELIHKMRKEMGYTDTKVSFANHVRIFEPENKKNPWHCICSVLLDKLFQGYITEAMCIGKFKMPLKSFTPIKSGEYCDFIAVNYYTRSTVTKFDDGVKKDAPKNDLGWEIYPEGIVRCSEQLYSLIKRPIYITENGTCDNTDAFRSRYIYEHLQAMCNSELPFERYYHWCFCDNFEWDEGESARFGIVHVNYETQERSIKNSGKFFAEVIKSGGVTEEIYDKYVKDQEYHY